MEDAVIIAITFQEHFTVDVLRGQQWLETIWHVMVRKGCASIVNSEWNASYKMLQVWTIRKIAAMTFNIFFMSIKTYSIH